MTLAKFRPLAAIATIAVLVPLAATGCGSKSSNSDIANPPTTTSTQAAATTTEPAKKEAAAGAQTLAVTSPASGALVFEPKALTAKAGDVTIDYKNPSPVPHNLALLGNDGKPLGEPTKIGSNNSGQVMAKLAAGTYRFICEVPGHEQAGMVGELKVS
jgi:plastocyanin